MPPRQLTYIFDPAGNRVKNAKYGFWKPPKYFEISLFPGGGRGQEGYKNFLFFSKLGGEGGGPSK